MPEVTINETSKFSQLQEFHDSGVSAFFRVLSNNLNQQNMLADNKANIMISINTVVLSLVIGSSARNIEFWDQLFVPMIMLVLTSLLTTVFAVLATRPNFKKGNFSQEDVNNKKSTLLFTLNSSSKFLNSVKSLCPSSMG
jgi:hypothetical protein